MRLMWTKDDEILIAFRKYKKGDIFETTDEIGSRMLSTNGWQIQQVQGVVTKVEEKGGEKK